MEIIKLLYRIEGVPFTPTPGDEKSPLPHFFKGG